MKPSVLNDTFFKDLDRSTRAVESAETLPPECYTDADFYELEKEALFNHEWLCVGRESDVSKPGDYFTTHIIDEPIIVVRNKKNAIKLLEFLVTSEAQEHIVNNTFEYPIIDGVSPSQLISQFGLDFKQDLKTKVSSYYKNQAEALKIMTEAGWN